MATKEKFEKAKRLYETANADQRYVLESLFPELKESEDKDERIRKEILEYFQQFENDELRGVNISDWIAWLEKQGEQKSAWSEEDEKMRNATIKFTLENGFIQTNLGHILITKGQMVDWLKSLRPQSQWKPSDEQMEALESATENCAYSEYQDCLRELLEQLKKLMEE